jgi:outer membrane protein OmpA-like peptidoglycan-associated protein
MKSLSLKKGLALLMLLPTLSIAQLSFEGLIKDSQTGTELEGAMVTVKPLRISGSGYFTGKLTERDGTFKTTTNYDYPLQIVVTKKGCKRKIVKVKKDKNVTSYEIQLDCEQETIDQIIAERTTDSDGDGVLDLDDECPETAGVEENKGCPWPDTDNDGVLDKDDACPEVAGVKEKRGCPVTDRDEDGVDDNKDNCPDEAGSAKNMGCPDQPNSITDLLKRTNILFSFNGVQPLDGSDSNYSDLSMLLKKYSYVNLLITGYASNEGPEQYNQLLSEKRSASVKAALEALGIDSSRLESVGQGEKEPLYANDSKENRAKNRVVRISIK